MTVFQTTLAEIKAALIERAGNKWLNLGDVDFLEHGGTQVTVEDGGDGVAAICLTNYLYNSIKDSYILVEEGELALSDIFTQEDEDTVFSPEACINYDMVGGILSFCDLDTDFRNKEDVVEFCLRLGAAWVEGVGSRGVMGKYDLMDFKLEHEDLYTPPYTEVYDKTLRKARRAVKRDLKEGGITEGF